jgi:hypothetical protein
MFNAFKGPIIFMELHDWIDGDAPKRDALRAAASKFFKITEITMGARDLSKFPKLRSFSDNDCWLIFSEGRGEMMTWYRMDPR